jgi:hypothetical protein
LRNVRCGLRLWRWHRFRCGLWLRLWFWFWRGFRFRCGLRFRRWFRLLRGFRLGHWFRLWLRFRHGHWFRSWLRFRRGLWRGFRLRCGLRLRVRRGYGLRFGRDLGHQGWFGVGLSERRDDHGLGPGKFLAVGKDREQAQDPGGLSPLQVRQRHEGACRIGRRLFDHLSVEQQADRRTRLGLARDHGGSARIDPNHIEGRRVQGRWLRRRDGCWRWIGVFGDHGGGDLWLRRHRVRIPQNGHGHSAGHDDRTGRRRADDRSAAASKKGAQ